MKTFKEFTTEAKVDTFLAISKLAKSALTSKNIIDSKKVIRNMRFFPKITKQTTADKMRLSKHFSRRGKNTILPNMPKDTPDKFSNLAIKRKSIYPPDVDASQKKVEDIFMDLTLKKVKRRTDKVDKLKRMYET